MAQAVIGPVSRWHDSGIVGVGPGLWYGPTALDGAAGDWKRAPLGSIYVQVDAAGTTTSTWQKIAKAGATADWIHLGGLHGLAGGQTIYGGTAANEDLTIEGTTSATKATSYVILQPTGGKVGVGTVTPGAALTAFDASSQNVLTIQSGAANVLQAAYTGLTLANVNNGTEAWYSAAIRNINTQPNPATIDPRLGLFTQDPGTWLPADVTEKVSILGSGEVGIGTITPPTILSVVDGLTTTGAILTLGTKETTVDASDVLGRINFYAPLEASGTDAILVGASITAVAEASFTAAVNATSLLFQTGASEVATTKMALLSTGNLGVGTIAPATLLHVAANETLTGNTTDDYSAALTLDPAYTGAFTVTRHNYIDVNDIALAGSAAVTAAALFRFDAAIGTHKALLTGSTKTTPTGVDAWIPINANGTIMYIPVYASTTA